ncbi:uncharacterized protein [Lolium perenne]|uniref:uncharacterized protein isoform X2 n=1 Tax=Lolium perenne TaxID=4522 RepID=UPI003A9920BB
MVARDVEEPKFVGARRGARRGGVPTSPQIFLIHVHVPEDLRPQQKIANIYFNAALADDWHGLERYDLVPYHAAHAQKQWRLRAAAGKSVEESLANKQSRRIYELSSTQSGST